MASVPEPKNVIYGLFCECHPERGIRYVGQTSQGARKRRYHHVNRAKGGADYAVSRWIRKHLPENIGYFTLEVLDDPRDLDRLEEWWIAELGTMFQEGGLNLWPGGRSVRGYKQPLTKKQRPPISDETRALQSLRMSGLYVGEKSPVASITDAQAVEIKRLAWSGVRRDEVAKIIGCSLVVVNGVVSGRSWSHIPNPLGERVAPPRKFPIKVPKIYSHGESHYMSKLTEEDVIQIRKRYDGGERHQDIATDYPHLTNKNISMVARRKTWKHVI